MTILGAILAGGAATRFGSDKALAPLGDRSLIEHVRQALAPRAERIVVCGRSHGDLTALADRPRAGLGPLGGLAAALAFAREIGFARVLTLPCDTPVVPVDLLAALVARDGAAYVADCPVIGVWPARLGDALDAFLTGGGRAVRAWGKTAGADALDLAAPANVNRPDDLAGLARGR